MYKYPCPECENGFMYINTYNPDWDVTGENTSYKLVCNHCDYTEEADWYDDDDENS